MKMAGIPFQETVLFLRKPGFDQNLSAFSSAGRVPVLVDGDINIWESLAICEYLAERFPEQCLWPKDRGMRAYARSISHEMHANFQALRQHLPCHFVARYQNFSIPPEAQNDINRVLSIWSGCRQTHAKEGPFLFGRFSIADAMYAPVVFRFLAYGVQVEDLHRAYMDMIEKLPAAKEWVYAAKQETERIEAYEKK
ncbi:MAG: glutathione S-transferase [Candidatus Omnitrophica bacterium CG11_big_fil_rev_8_21_14_0_20_45_26]|uniref:Glutathione S-transferase n=1 Tax=Candidatus Abzuiibacterium crystallinum TaxID=1974748 RepID=A0A2H0LL43_9BACT|nr:MAG: glutathione S-transferase [Candidatus Omnitrophica bacterium CG11_big_fil_rev_8_21_14_0_20_45_26]PIW63826.1 MAG: glutathione S-transferase [Candidatus Omnitrophica bacterium CG12_big_fil_rev_8_21_14_0_65_45_16]